MKITTILHCFTLSIFTCIGLLQAEGFTAHTIVTTPSGYTEIEQLQTGDKVISYTCFHTPKEYPVTNITTSTTDCYIKICVDGEYIRAAPGQKFYLHGHKKWIPAHKLLPTDLLMNNKGDGVQIDTVETINEQCVVYLLSVDTSHTFCVSRHNIIAHNFAETVVVPVITCATNFVITNTPAIIEVAKVTFASLAFVGAHLLQKRSEKSRKIYLLKSKILSQTQISITIIIGKILMMITITNIQTVSMKNQNIIIKIVMAEKAPHLKMVRNVLITLYLLQKLNNQNE